MPIIENVRPEDIERRSFEIIEEELKARGLSVPSGCQAVSGDELGLCRSIIYRCIHTTADFDYARTLRFSKGAAGILRKLICDGAYIVTDTNMALAGINKSRLEKSGGRACCFMADEDVASDAKRRGVTRAYVSMEKALGLRPLICAVGNAPTALLSLHESYMKRSIRPDLIIGVPVGFVNVVRSKELIMDTDIPYIINEGNKGGSPVAAAIINAVLYDIQ